ncbi:MAG: hypothetical protein EOO41_02795, partial [Methanobacteriota archaeon]
MAASVLPPSSPSLVPWAGGGAAGEDDVTVETFLGLGQPAAPRVGGGSEEGGINVDAASLATPLAADAQGEFDADEDDASWADDASYDADVAAAHADPRFVHGSAPRCAQAAAELRAFARRLLAHGAATACLAVASVFVLFATDVRTLAFTIGADMVFEVLTSVCFFVFIVELVLRCWVHTRYALESLPDGEPPAGVPPAGEPPSQSSPPPPPLHATSRSASSVAEKMMAASHLPPLATSLTSPQQRPASVLEAAWRVACCGRRRRVVVSGYVGSLFFVLDILAIISLLPDMQWLSSVAGLDLSP